MFWAGRAGRGWLGQRRAREREEMEREQRERDKGEGERERERKGGDGEREREEMAREREPPDPARSFPGTGGELPDRVRESSRTLSGPSRQEGLPELLRALPARVKKLTAKCWRDNLIAGSGSKTLIARTLYSKQAGIN